MSDSLAGKLLVATPRLQDPNFHRTVVLLLAHDANGAFGVVLNRPLAGMLASDHVATWSEHIASPGTLFAGGPVEPEMALGVARARGGNGDGGWRPLMDGIGLLDLTRHPEEVDATIERLRVFTGYAGWGAGQLENEIDQQAWFVVDAIPDDAFSPEPDQLARAVLSRQSGELRLYALFPEQPNLN